ncbi:hypothetical protein [Crocosphaera sp.]|uniref:hypothetical protein n=1 Tax=Crocosphaera sp. TaxID=2729996 RepID=UPI00260A191B|nr:hypothetical protein [Crocosphaera sp.]MDJ0582519.1 hypothetical protein [Crocosphaera sp.]
MQYKFKLIHENDTKSTCYYFYFLKGLEQLKRVDKVDGEVVIAQLEAKFQRMI